MAFTDHTYGIEVECYLPDGGTSAQCAAAITARGVFCRAESYNHLTTAHWKIVTDGSLGDYHRGIEIVSPVLQGLDGFVAITKVMEALTDYGCTVSKRCGLHVHVGAGSASTAFFKNIFKLYAHFEPVIDRFMPASRRASANMYCRSVTSTSLQSIDRAADLDGLLRLMTVHGAEARYHKLNLIAYRRHRTVEFRQHSGTLDGVKALYWTRLCLKMVEAAQNGQSIDASNGPAVNTARPGTKGYMVGQLMLRPEGVTRDEARAATGWPSISLPQRARECGLSYTTQRTGREVRYFAQAAAASTAIPATLEGMFAKLEFDGAERTYFTARTANLSGAVAWAA
jgi:hypothetical protein